MCWVVKQTMQKSIILIAFAARSASGYNYIWRDQINVNGLEWYIFSREHRRSRDLRTSTCHNQAAVYRYQWRNAAQLRPVVGQLGAGKGNALSSAPLVAD